MMSVAAFQVVQDRAVVLLHAARGAARAAGVDDAGEIVCGRLSAICSRRSRQVRVVRGQLRPVMNLNLVRESDRRGYLRRR